MPVRPTALRLAPLVTIFALGALALAAPASAERGQERSAISKVAGTLTVPAPTVGVNDHLTARLTGEEGLERGVLGKKLIFTTVATANTPATVLCVATTDVKGVGTCDALVGLDPKQITSTGTAQLAAKGAFIVTFSGDTCYFASNGKGASTFYGTPALPGSSARRKSV